MLLAIIRGERVEASPKTTGKCPLCASEVISKCGEINVWHWAHRREESCDDWYEPETEWHKRWKLAFGTNNCEKVITKDGVKHIADILTNNGVVIELQNSPMPNLTCYDRENFYGEQMVWIINGQPFQNNFSIYPPTLSFGEEWYWRNEVVYTESGIVEKDTGEIVTKPEKDFTFSWRWPRKSWLDAKRKIFIDFGTEDIFQVKLGMGANQGAGMPVSKESFLKEYHGDAERLNTLIRKKY